MLNQGRTTVSQRSTLQQGLEDIKYPQICTVRMVGEKNALEGNYF
jgi:hypothetical protein